MISIFVLISTLLFWFVVKIRIYNSICDGVNLIEILIFTATSFAVGLSGAMVPGPMMTVTISDSLKKGFVAGPLVVIGHYLAELSIILLIFAGLGWFISSSTAVFVIGTLGGFMMVFIG